MIAIRIFKYAQEGANGLDKVKPLLTAFVSCNLTSALIPNSSSSAHYIRPFRQNAGGMRGVCGAALPAD